MQNSSPHAEIVSFVNSNDLGAQIEAVLKQISAQLSELLDVIRIEHIGSTAIPDSLTKGDLDVVCQVSDKSFSQAKSILSRIFRLNEGTEITKGFCSFECDDYEISVGIQLMSDSAEWPPFLEWKQMLMSDQEIKTEYDDLKRQFDGRSMTDYRTAKEKLICKYLPDENSNEYAIYEQIQHELLKRQTHKDRPVRVAINGIEGSGKTTFAKKLAFYLQQNKIDAIHVSIEGYHYDQTHRYKQGQNSAKGYYEDSYNETGFVDNVLLLSQNDHPTYIPALYDLKTDQYLKPKRIEISRNTILITDGAYLFKPVFLPHWDLRIYLKVDFETALQRGIDRDARRLGGTNAARKKFCERYHPASTIYLRECSPERHADLIIGMSDFQNLKVLKADL